MSLKLSEKARVRLAWMDAYRETGNAAQICRHFSIPLRTFWRWKDRYDPWGLRSLEDRKRGPRQSPRRTPWETERRVIALKRAHPRWGNEKPALVLRRRGVTVSGKTCWRICHRHSLIVRYRTRKRRTRKPRLNWAEVRTPGDLLELDTKQVSFHGQRFYQYTAIDVVSRFRYAEIHRGCTTATTVKFLRNLRQQAAFPVSMIQSDNGKEFGKRLSRWCAKRHIRHVFSHARRVAATLIERGELRADILSLALLHDVVEDSNTPSGVIVDLFGAKRWGQLVALSKYVPVFDPVTGQITGRYKKATDDYFSEIAAADRDVRLVKLADRLDNLRSSLQDWPMERRMPYATETVERLLPIAQATDPWFSSELKLAVAAALHHL